MINTFRIKLDTPEQLEQFQKQYGAGPGQFIPCVAVVIEINIDRIQSYKFEYVYKEDFDE